MNVCMNVYVNNYKLQIVIIKKRKKKIYSTLFVDGMSYLPLRLQIIHFMFHLLQREVGLSFPELDSN